jgi:curved DNA-binding protein CbpA
MATAYTVLGVLPTASQEEIAAAFRTRSIDCHPDKATGDADRSARTAKMAKLTLAWRYLRDPESRASYDRKLAAMTQQAPPEGSSSAPDMLGQFQGLDPAHAGNRAADLGREMGLGPADLERAKVIAERGVGLFKSAADLIGLVRGNQR